MKELAMAIALLILGSVIGTVFLAVMGRNRDDLPGPPDESENWYRTTAEVLSVFRTHNRIFILVRYRVGTSLIENDVTYPLGGAMPRAGQRVAVKYDPMSPARVVLDGGRPGAPKGWNMPGGTSGRMPGGQP